VRVRGEGRGLVAGSLELALSGLGGPAN